MSDYQYDLICLGCGPAGEKAASQASYFKHRVAIIERQPRPGGAMVNTGTVPSKALRETALVCSALKRRNLPGHDFEFDHELSVPSFMARCHLVEQQEHDRIESSIDRHEIDVHRGHGRLVDGHTVTIEGPDGTTTTITGEYILVATGSSPLRPDHVPFDHPTVVDADGVLEMERLPRSMIVVGGGVIGSEYASIFAEINVQVTLIHPRGEILGFLEPECREHLTQAMINRGVHVLTDTTVETVEPVNDRTVKVTLGGGGELCAEALLWAAGRQSNTADLGLEAAGVILGKRGLIPVDEHYCTNVPSIYAAGDAIGFPALAATSMEQGRIAACHMFDIEFKKELASTMPIGIYTIPAVSMVGLTAVDALEKGLEIVIGRALYRYNVRGRMLGDSEGILKCVFDRRTRKLLGASIVGEQATELIHLAQATIAHGGGIADFIGACYNYPSLTELYKYAAYDALQTLACDEGRRDEMAVAAKVA